MDDSSCRVCLTRASNKSLSVFNDVNDVPINDKLQFVTGVVISQDDPFSKFMCSKCFTDTNTAYNLKERCLDADITLKNRLKLQIQELSIAHGTVKNEPIDAHLDPVVFIEPIVKTEVIDKWTESIESVNCLNLKLEDTREEITTKQVTSTRKKSSSSRTKKSQSKVCETNLPSLQNLTLHMNEHEEKNIYKCTEINCDYSTESEKKLSNHIARHSNVPKCKDCDASFSSMTKLLNHRKSEHPETFDQNEKPSQNKELMPCEICGKLIISRHMRDHKESVHLKITKFECDFCSRKFFFKYSMIRHLRKHIPEEFKSQPYECDICRQKFHKICQLKRHISLKHVTEESEFLCHCGKIYQRERSLRDHIRKVHRLEKSVCNICGKSYHDKSGLRKHIEISHTKNYQKRFMCNICGATYHGQSELSHHQKSVHEEKIFVCRYPDCKKKFPFRFLLIKHEKISHLKIKSFFCSEPNCNKSFAANKPLQKHIMISHKKIRENCPVGNGCKFSVGRRDYMRNHLKKHSELSSKELEKYLEIIKEMNLF